MKTTLLLAAGATALALTACTDPAKKAADEAPAADQAGTDASTTAPSTGDATTPTDGSTTIPPSTGSAVTPLNPDGTPMNPPPTLPTDPGVPSPSTTPPAQ